MIKRLLLYISGALVLLLSSCDKDSDPKVPENSGVVQSTLLYAVNYNNLSGDLVSNKNQIIEALKKLPEGKYEYLVYQTIDQKSAGLFRAVSGENANFEQVVTYDRETLSTDPKRLAQVIADSRAFSEVEERDLFFWGHGWSWTPTANRERTFDLKNPKYYGGDNFSSDWMDIDEMALAVPEGVYDLIWFDCCYMGNIETIYQLRKKANYIVAYPTEIWSFGLPYHLVVPNLLSDNRDIVKAAEALYNYYDGYAVTVSVMDMSKIDELASSCKAIYASTTVRPQDYTLLNYSRHAPKYYDLRQYARECASLSGHSELIPALDKAMSNFMVYTAASERDFSNRIIPKENYSGVSTHYFINDPTDQSFESTFYRSLDWFKAVY